MITPQELRIGNWLMYGIKPVQVQYIDPEREIIDMGLKCSIGVAEYVDKHHIATNGRWLNHFEPIPLTLEVLVNCGFKKFNLSSGHYCQFDFNNKEAFLFDNSLSYGIMGVANYEWSAADHIKHLHQLQNLFYALTSEELNYTT